MVECESEDEDEDENEELLSVECESEDEAEDGDGDEELLSVNDEAEEEVAGEIDRQGDGNGDCWSGDLSERGVGSAVAAFDVWGVELGGWGDLLENSP